MKIDENVTSKLTKNAFNRLQDRILKVHGNRYLYDKLIYKGSEEPVIITCRQHGDFVTTTHTHLKGWNCPTCTKIKIARSKRKTTAQFIEEAKKVHGDKFDYSNTVYTTNNVKLKIICKVHGEFTQYPNGHLTSKHGCELCGNMARADVISDTKEEFVAKALAVYPLNQYSYTEVNYINNRTKVQIYCNRHKGSFMQTPSSHLLGHECNVCYGSGFNQNKLAILYYLSINNGEAYKIGITNRSVEKRFSNKDLRKINIIAVTEYMEGTAAYDLEQQILTKFKHYKYVGKPLLESGNTELFSKDIMQLPGFPNLGTLRSNRTEVLPKRSITQLLPLPPVSDYIMHSKQITLLANLDAAKRKLLSDRGQLIHPAEEQLLSYLNSKELLYASKTIPNTDS